MVMHVTGCLVIFDFVSECFRKQIDPCFRWCCNAFRSARVPFHFVPLKPAYVSKRKSFIGFRALFYPCGHLCSRNTQLCIRHYNARRTFDTNAPCAPRCAKPARPWAGRVSRAIKRRFREGCISASTSNQAVLRSAPPAEKGLYRRLKPMPSCAGRHSPCNTPVGLRQVPRPLSGRVRFAYNGCPRLHPSGARLPARFRRQRKTPVRTSRTGV